MAFGFVGGRVEFCVAGPSEAPTISGLGVADIRASWVNAVFANTLLASDVSIEDRLILKLLLVRWIRSIGAPGLKVLDGDEITYDAAHYLNVGATDATTPFALGVLTGAPPTVLNWTENSMQQLGLEQPGPVSLTTIAWTNNSHAACSAGHVVAVLGRLDVDGVPHLVFRDQARLPLGTLACSLGIESNQLKPVHVSPNREFTIAEQSEPSGCLAVPSAVQWESFAQAAQATGPAGSAMVATEPTS